MDGQSEVAATAMNTATTTGTIDWSIRTGGHLAAPSAAAW